MVKYRQLHTKTVDSFDFNDMPNDFIRVTWLLLPLILDREGRGIYSMPWIKSKMYPLRNDVSTKQLQEAFNWLIDKKMIITYQPNGHEYFYIPTWKEHQSGTHKEALSLLPPPPDNVQTKSDLNPKAVGVLASASESESASVYESDPDLEDLHLYDDAFKAKTHIVNYTIETAVKAFTEIKLSGATVEDMLNAIDEMVKKRYAISSPFSIIKPSIMSMNFRLRSVQKEPEKPNKHWDEVLKKEVELTNV
jgi:hypothetical protein